jgi:hypothetical protein
MIRECAAASALARFAGSGHSQCAREDSNLRGPYSPRGQWEGRRLAPACERESGHKQAPRRLRGRRRPRTREAAPRALRSSPGWTRTSSGKAVQRHRHRLANPLRRQLRSLPTAHERRAWRGTGGAADALCQRRVSPARSWKRGSAFGRAPAPQTAQTEARRPGRRDARRDMKAGPTPCQQHGRRAAALPERGGQSRPPVLVELSTDVGVGRRSRIGRLSSSRCAAGALTVQTAKNQIGKVVRAG